MQLATGSSGSNRVPRSSCLCHCTTASSAPTWIVQKKSQVPRQGRLSERKQLRLCASLARFAPTAPPPTENWTTFLYQSFGLDKLFNHHVANVLAGAIGNDTWNDLYKIKHPTGGFLFSGTPQVHSHISYLSHQQTISSRRWCGALAPAILWLDRQGTSCN